ncbi:zinc metalloproteinase nas-14 [Drosophila takahashii]|uniref:zinc metalloproteinase nas-14 n=1 Tax=Drosophila takahashii TaxID=29030 RepID=UPI001CF8787F|nr:zinc metalloproteinase nas-14 [Drosophila takahashii]
MLFQLLTLLFTIGSLGHARPPLEILEDDIVLIPEQQEFFEGSPQTRIARSWAQYYWKESTLVYSFGEGLSTSDIDRVESAMSEISSQTCVRFRRTADRLEPQVIIQRQGPGCKSSVGYLGRANQTLNLAKGCMSSKIIQHELLHALSFYHTQSDPQRDSYVEIHMENIKSGHEHNFKKLLPNGVSDFGLGYDYDSIMHYGPLAFSKNGKPTIVPLKADAKIGQATQLSPIDVETLKRMYC